jgi:mannosyl-oligosaccharide alpha-1,2-mannosidase
MAPLTRSFLTVVVLSSLTLANTIQSPTLSLPSDAPAQRDAVQKIFTDSYAAYKRYAFGHDDLSPISKGFSDGRNGWGATIVDAMSTMVSCLFLREDGRDLPLHQQIMGLTVSYT